MQTATSISPKHQSSRPRCSYCGRTLTEASSIARGAGPECSGKLARTNAAVSAGRNVQAVISDNTLSRLGADLSQLERIQVIRPDSVKLQRDIHAARIRYANRVEFLAKQGFLYIPDPAEIAPLAPFEDMPANGEPMIEQRELRKDGRVRVLPLSEAVKEIQSESIAATNRYVIKQIQKQLRAGEPYENWVSAYRLIP